MADIFIAVEHQPLFAISRHMAQLATSALGVKLNVLIQMSELPQSSWFVELLNFELVAAADIAVTSHDLDAKKRGAADRYALFTRASIPLSDRIPVTVSFS